MQFSAKFNDIKSRANIIATLHLDWGLREIDDKIPPLFSSAGGLRQAEQIPLLPSFKEEEQSEKETEEQLKEEVSLDNKEKITEKDNHGSVNC